MAHIDFIPSGNTSSCPTEMTRADLINLRTLGVLDVNCAYVITDFTQGNINGSKVLLRAVNSSTLSMNATIYVTSLQFNVPDNSGWKCVYDIDTNLLTEVWDNRNNYVRGSAAITAFPWGNTVFSGNIVDQTVLTVPYGQTTLAVAENTFLKSFGGGINFTGSGGLIFRSTFSGGGAVNLSGATNVQIQNSELHGATVNSVGHTTALFRINGSRLEVGGQIISSTNTQCTFGFGKLAQGSLLSHTAGQFDGLNCLIENFSRINVTGANSVSFQSSRIAEQSVVNFSATNLTTSMLASTISQFSTCTITGTRTANINYTRNNLLGSSTETITGSGASALNYNGNITTSGSTKNITNCSVNHQFNFVSTGSTLNATSNTGNKSLNSVIGGSTLTIPANTVNVNNNEVSSGYSLNTSTFSATNTRARGLATTTLTANNTNRYVDAGTLGLI